MNINQSILKPSVAGKFYPADTVSLRRDVIQYIESADIQPAKTDLFSILSPHAGYPFSGPVAGYSFKYASKQNPDTVLFIALSHYGINGGSVFAGDAFETPLGKIAVDQALTHALIELGEPIVENVHPFIGEHSIEVNLPFVQVAFPEAKIAAVLMSHTDLDLCKSIGRRIAHIIEKTSDQNVLVVVSSDMSHFPDYETANTIDVEMLKTLESLDLQKSYDTLDELEHTPCSNLYCVMCGSAAMFTAVEAANTLGGYQGKLLHYQNSGDSPYGDHDRVVGYGSFAIERQ